MQVLVTGGAGYIGSHTVVELINAGHQVIIVDDLSNAKASVIARIEEITGVRPLFYQLNCCSSKLIDVFKKHSIDAVIHFAGFKAVGESVHKPLQYYRNNIDSTLMLLEAMEGIVVSRVNESAKLQPKATTTSRSSLRGRSRLPVKTIVSPYNGPSGLPAILSIWLFSRSRMRGLFANSIKSSSEEPVCIMAR